MMTMISPTVLLVLLGLASSVYGATTSDSTPTAAPESPMCSCSPTKFTFVLSLDQTCDNNDIEENTVLIIFSEPHAYISPKHYEKELNVPTWNYISVHAYGKGKLLTGKDETFAVLEATIDNYEKAYRKQWDGLPEDYKLKMANGIVAFEITVTDLQAKKKLSQNRTETERKNIIDSLSGSDDTNEQRIAEFMRKDGIRP